MNKATKIALEFARKCLLLHRLLPVEDYIALRFWGEYCHNLCWLIEDVENLQHYALDCYINTVPKGAINIRICRAISSKDIENAYLGISKAIENVFGKENGHMIYLKDIKKLLSELQEKDKEKAHILL